MAKRTKGKVWSFNTSVRNPIRILNNLKAIEKFEGMENTAENQAKYFWTLIKNKFYKPRNTPKDLIMEYEFDGVFDDSSTDRIYDSYVGKKFDKSGRGRTALAPLRKTGLIIWGKNEKLQITKLGRLLLNGDVSFEEFMFKFCLKWELPNPIDKGMKDFDIKPFIATLKVIYEVNEVEKNRGNKEKGISIEEFKQYVIPIKHYLDIEGAVSDIINYRDCLKKSENKSSFKEKSMIESICKTFEINPSEEYEITKSLNNLRDYADSAIRYFRITGYINFRGYKRFIDINPNRLEESKDIISQIGVSSSHYENKKEYISYLSDIHSPELPWESRETLEKIFSQLNTNIKNKQADIINQYPNVSLNDYSLDINITNINTIDLKKIINNLRNNVENINKQFIFIREKNKNNLNEYKEELRRLGGLKPSKSNFKEPIELEWYTSLSLMSIDDAEKIKPNLKIGDDGEPTFTAPGNKADIECFYENFNLSVEVTMMKNRSQTEAEVQPVMRHLRSLEDKYDKKFYCLFIAPVIHRDTLNTFWPFVLYGYEGRKQNIIPLTLNQYINILNIIDKYRIDGKIIDSNDLENLFEKLSQVPHNPEVESPQWMDTINECLNSWDSSLI
ncbi:AlwI family type II restriction endonuclease [Methanobrevibacter sp.]|uniref:AlwI family type II restriction endonuclease n=1 Tax=Methanobrevibacter sp. TaxID=66852 RepID=UPI002612216C|nr:AlwI family type II restriction endonuclease [uncultured Methanobrevibacter sp.]